MSAALVKNRNAPHTFVDNLKSIFYVILWLSVMYSPNSLSPAEPTSFIKSILDPEQFGGMGGTAKADFLQAHTTLRQLKFDGRPKLQPLLMNLATFLSVRYEDKPTKDDLNMLATFEGSQTHKERLPAWTYEKRSTDLESHSYIIKVITEYIQCPNKWPDKDLAARQSLIDPPDEGKKRKTKMGWDLSDKPIKKLRLESQ